MEDPTNLDEVILGFPSDNPSAVYQYVKDALPGWIVEEAPQFAVDLYRFNTQWALACVQMKVEPQKVLIVSETFIHERNQRNHKYKLVEKAIIKLSENGYIVMDKHTFGRCSQCEEVIVSRTIMTEKNYSFSGKCQKCFPYDPKKPLPAGKTV